MKANGSEINKFIKESWYLNLCPLDGWYINDNGNVAFDEYEGTVKDSDFYDLEDFGYIVPYDGNLIDYSFTFEDGFNTWKRYGICIPPVARINKHIKTKAIDKNDLIQKIEAVKEKLRFVGVGRQSLLALQFEMRVVSEMLEKIIKELSENE